MRRPPAAAAWAALGFCILAAWLTYGRDGRMPLLASADLGFHELGHLVMYLLPISELLTAAMGSIFQIAVPLGLATYFAWYRRDLIGASFCLAWAGTSARDVSIYIADAPVERLQLIGGEHDWAYILGPEQLDRLAQAASIARTVRSAGLMMLLGAGLLAVWVLVSSRSGAADPDAAIREPRAARWPTT